jgi:hypothetical protein
MTRLFPKNRERNVDNLKMQSEALDLGAFTSFGGLKHRSKYTKKPSSKRVQKKLKEQRANNKI